MPVVGPADVAYGAAVLVVGAAAAAVMAKGFQTGIGGRRTGRDADGFGFGLANAPSARRARDVLGKRTQWPPNGKEKDQEKDQEKDEEKGDSGEDDKEE